MKRWMRFLSGALAVITTAVLLLPNISVAYAEETEEVESITTSVTPVTDVVDEEVSEADAEEESDASIPMLLAEGDSFYFYSTKRSGASLITNSSGTSWLNSATTHEASDGTPAYCFSQGRANPNGEYVYIFSGYADSEAAAILDAGWPNNTTIGGYELTADAARQATQVALWCVSNDYNKNTVTITTVRSTGRDDGSALAAAKYLVNVASKQSSDSLYSIYKTADATSGYQIMLSTLNEKPAIEYATLKLVKASANTTMTSGNSAYSLANAVYGVYSNSACTTKVATLTTNSNGVASVTLEVGIYYVKEITASTGYEVDKTVYKADLTTADATITLSVKEQPSTGGIALTKKSSDNTLVSGNSCYSLQGAVYGVYSDSACTKKVTTMTTDSKGAASTTGLALGTFYVKEISASPGYLIDTTVYPVTITAGGTAKLSVQERPAYDPIGISLTKIQEYSDGYVPSLAGAQFTVKFYGGQYDSVDALPDTPTRTWVIQTLEYALSDGTIYYQARFDDANKVSGDAFYYDDAGRPVFPLGTITIEETLAPTGYTLEGKYMNDSTGANVQDENGIILLNVLADDSLNTGGFLNGGNAYTLVEEIDACSLILVKKDEAGTLLSGVSFQLDRLIPTTGTWEAFRSGTTDSNGRLVFEDLVYGTYRVTELSTGDGTSLLKEPIVVSLPGAEGNEVVLDVTNAALLAMPFTGGLGTTPFLLCGVTIMLCAAIIWLNISHRDKRKL